jgi:hypothetical protein
VYGANVFLAAAAPDRSFVPHWECREEIELAGLKRVSGLTMTYPVHQAADVGWQRKRRTGW